MVVGERSQVVPLEVGIVLILYFHITMVILVGGVGIIIDISLWYTTCKYAYAIVVTSEPNIYAHKEWKLLIIEN